MRRALPLDVRHAGPVVGGASHGEEQVREPIDVCHEQSRDFITSERDDRALGTPTHRTRHVQLRAGSSAPGEDELPKGRKLGFKRVDPLLQPRHGPIVEHRLFDACRDSMTRIGEERSEREEITLKAIEHLDEIAIGDVRSNQTEPRRQFIDVAVGVDARIRLGDARAIEQTRLAGIAGSRVDTGQGSPIMAPCQRDEGRCPSRILRSADGFGSGF